MTDYPIGFLGGSQEGPRIKRTRPSDAGNDVDSDLDERNNQLQANYVPPGFISPSVIEYLELGKSIPGMFELNQSIEVRRSCTLGILYPAN